MTGFAKTNLMGTNTQIHFLSVDESHTHALSKDTKHLRLDGQVCFYRWLFSDTVKSQGCILWSLWPLKGIIRLQGVPKLISNSRPDHPYELCQPGSPTDEQHCHLCLSACFSLPTAPHPPPHTLYPTPPHPTYPPL